MRRPFDFDDAAQEAARFRQWGLCAYCGESLDDEWEHAHHVIPNQVGQAGREGDEFLRSADNCVILCEQCHEQAHGGNWRTGSVAPAAWYGYSHGRGGLGAQAAWVARIESEWKRLFTDAPVAAKS
jgi:hypothetical protein